MKLHPLHFIRASALCVLVVTASVSAIEATEKQNPLQHEGHTAKPEPSNPPMRAPTQDHAQHATTTMPPAAMPSIPAHWSKPVSDQMLRAFILFDQLEYRLNDGDDAIRWDITGWYGGDYNKLWFKTEGDQRVSGETTGTSENQLLYSRLVTPFWDFQAGLRYDQGWGPGHDPSRTFGVIGLEGFAPYQFEVEPALFISEHGDVSAKFTTSIDLFLTQRLILQPRFDTEVAAQDAKKFGVAQGINNIELSLRLRYEIRHRFAPYIGVHWRRLLGETGGLARRNGEDVDILGFVAGVRLWF